jgi:hypothetical protein
MIIPPDYKLWEVFATFYDADAAENGKKTIESRRDLFIETVETIDPKTLVVQVWAPDEGGARGFVKGMTWALDLYAIISDTVFRVDFTP